MRFLTYNLWHGLAPSSPVSMTSLEPESRRVKRHKLQLELLAGVEFDVGFFQEVNPLLDRSEQFHNVLKKDVSIQSDLVGVKVLGLGIPGNLNSGLLTVASSKYQMRKIQGVKLSGQGSSLVTPWLSVQFREERFALMSEILTQDLGRVLVVNTHLHHGLELTEELEQDLKQVGKDLSLSSNVQSELLERVRKGNDRRLREIKVLMDAIEKIESRYSMVVVGGDFNSRPDGQLKSLFNAFGFKDSFEGQTKISNLSTFDQEANKANHMLQMRFPLSVKFDDLTFSDNVRSILNSTMTKHEIKGRRIDQVWVKTSKPFTSKVELIGQSSDDGFAPSDHFGYLVDINFRSEQ